jgi:glycine betaine/proline transport system substrate-binding protein
MEMMHKMNRFGTVLRQFNVAVVASIITMAAVDKASAQSAENPEPIKVALFDWTTVNINAKIFGGVLEQLGYNVEYPVADYLSSLTTGLTNGDLTIALEYWDTTASDAMKASEATGLTERLGKLGPKAMEGWWYPMYMKEKCPGLPSWEALKSKECAEAFATPETTPNGRYLGPPVSWQGFDDERVSALDLPFEVVHAGIESAMFAELDSAYQRKAPIMLLLYTPHWASAKYQGEWVQFPEYTPECYNDPKWGVNQDKAYDCGKPHGELWKFAWIEMKQKWPLAYKIARHFEISTDEINRLAAEVDLDGRSVEDVAAEWVEKNEAKWRSWASDGG